MLGTPVLLGGAADGWLANAGMRRVNVDLPKDEVGLTEFLTMLGADHAEALLHRGDSSTTQSRSYQSAAPDTDRVLALSGLGSDSDSPAASVLPRSTAMERRLAGTSERNGEFLTASEFRGAYLGAGVSA